MHTYHCEKCDMEIKAPECAECDEELTHKQIDSNNKKVQVCECPTCHGKIKSPQCCGADMKYS